MKIIKENEFRKKTEKQIGKECYSIALANEFIDTEKAFVGHIFGNSDFQRFFAIDDADDIMGFTVIEFPKLKDITLCYIGIVFIDKNSQGLGLSKRLMTKAVRESGVNPDVIALRTQNARMFGSFVDNFQGLSFPNPEFETPNEVIGIVRRLQCAKDIDGIQNLSADLIVKRAYPNSFLHQPSRNSFANQICSSLGEQDAVVPTIITNSGREKILGKLIYRSGNNGISGIA